jgi:hypothetical protein
LLAGRLADALDLTVADLATRKVVQNRVESALTCAQAPGKMHGMKLTDQIRAAVNASGRTRRSLCLAAGIDEASLSRFMAGKTGLSNANLDALAEVLRLRLAGVPQKPRKTSQAGRRKGR